MNGLNLPKNPVEMAVESKMAANHEQMMNALQELAGDDPSFHAEIEPESGQTIVKGMSEAHLDIKIDILRRQYMIDVNIGAPQVIYRETITRRAVVDYTHKKQSGDTSQFARVKLVVEPGEENSGLVIETETGGSAVPVEFLPGVERGLQSVLTSGTIVGYGMIDMKVSLSDGAYHQSDSSEIAFEIASRAAAREAIAKAGPVLLEPIMKIEVVSPEEFLQSIINDLIARRGRVADTTSRGDAQVVNASVPLAQMFGYARNLHSMTQGRAVYTMAFDHYEIAGSSSNNPGPDDAPPAAMAMRA